MKYSIIGLILYLTVSFAWAEPNFINNPIAFQKIKVNSWKAQRDLGVVKQDLDFSCGAASIATLLNGFYGQNVNEAEILELMEKQNWRASFDDMQRIMPHLGFQAKGYALSFEQLQELKIPVIVYLKYRKNDHFSVLKGINQNAILLADPSLGNVSMSKAQFLEAWNTREGALSGKILAILPSENNLIQGQPQFFTKQPARQTDFITKVIKTNPAHLF